MDEEKAMLHKTYQQLIKLLTNLIEQLKKIADIVKYIGNFPNF